MATLKQLHELIHALDKSEKKYLSMMIEGVAGKAKTRYADSLKHINALNEFDADKLKDKLSKGVQGMNLSEANTNFYNFICKAMIAYHSNTEGQISFMAELMEAEFLLNKGLYETAHQVLQSLTQKLTDTGSFSLIHRVYELQNKLNIHYRKLSVNYESRYEHYKERLQVIDEHKQFVEIVMLNTQFYELAQRVGEPRTEQDLKQYLDFGKHPLLQVPFRDVNTRILGTYVTLILALKNLSEPEKEHTELFTEAKNELKSRFVKKDYNTYLQEYYVLDYIVAEAVFSKNVELAQTCVAELSYLYDKVTSNGHKAKIRSRILMLELNMCLWVKDYVKGKVIINTWIDTPHKELWINATLSYINIILAARLYYLADNPNKALDYLLMLNDFEKVMRPSVHISYRFLFLLCHYKLKNYQFLSSATESLYRLLLKMEKLHAPEKALLKFVKKCDHFDKVKDEMHELKQTFSELENDKYHKSFFVFGDYREWLGIELKK